MKRVINKASIIFPLSMIYTLQVESITISIPELGIYWSYGTSTFVFISLFVLWVCCSPLRKSCCNGRWSEVLFNLAPIEILSVMIFAQWHFVLSIVLFLAWLVIEITFALYLRNDESRYRYTEKRHQMYKNIFRRCTVLALSVVCAIPCFMAAFVYDFRSPTYQAEEDIWYILFAESEQPEVYESVEKDLYLENINLLSYFDAQKWDKLDVNEKITIMQALVDFESERLGIPSIPVTAEILGAFTLGEYSDETKEMWIDVEHLSESPVSECIQTICHETFHSFQHYLVENMDWENDVLQNAYFEELREWKNNQENYISAWSSGFDAYENQPLEVSARNYAEEETERILSYIN